MGWWSDAVDTVTDAAKSIADPVVNTATFGKYDTESFLGTAMGLDEWSSFRDKVTNAVEVVTDPLATAITFGKYDTDDFLDNALGFDDRTPEENARNDAEKAANAAAAAAAAALAADQDQARVALGLLNEKAMLARSKQNIGDAKLQGFLANVKSSQKLPDFAASSQTSNLYNPANTMYKPLGNR